MRLLAVGSVTAGFVGLPQFWRELLGVRAPFYDFLSPVLGHAQMRAGVPHSAEFWLMLVAIAVAAAGIALAWMLFGQAGLSEPAAPQREGALRRIVSSGYGFDAFYDGVVVRFMGWLSATVLARGVEPALSATVIGAPQHTGPALGRWLARMQTGDLQAYVIYALIGLVLVLGYGALHG